MQETQGSWDASWAAIDLSIFTRDVWLLTDRIKLHYLLEQVAPGARALEVGCGGARLSALLAERGLHLTCLDLAPSALRLARNNFRALDAQGAFTLGSAAALPFASGQFDLVFSTGLLEHFRDPLPIIGEMVRVLRPGGLFFSDIAPLKFSLLRMGFYLRGQHRHSDDEYPYTGDDIEGWLRACGLEQIRVFASGVVPPLGLIRRSGTLRDLAFKYEGIWRSLDGTWLAEQTGFYFLAFARKPR